MANKNIQIKNHNGTDWDNLYPKTKASITEMNNGKTVEQEITSLSSNKVDKVSGKSLSTNDYTTAEKNKLSGLKDHTNEISSLETNKVDKVTGKGLSTNDFTTAEKNKLTSLKDHTADISNLSTNKADKSTTYTKTEVNNLISSSIQDIPVSKDEPPSASMWFEEL